MITMPRPELKPCPFCGGEAHLFGIETIGASVAYFVKCVGNKSKCAGPIRTKYCDTKERAAEVWNTRAERTCHNDLKDSDFDNVWPIPHFKCSSCGDMFPTCDFDYCPSCGAKVVDE